VGEVVGLKRAALFYYFRDKQALYDAVIEDAFGALVARLDAAFSAPSSIAARVERAVEAWVDTIVERPTLALILRHAAEAEERPTSPSSPPPSDCCAWRSRSSSRAAPAASSSRSTTIRSTPRAR
jgi:AcrR family transcriptional regulator